VRVLPTILLLLSAANQNVGISFTQLIIFYVSTSGEETSDQSTKNLTLDYKRIFWYSVHTF